MAVNPVNGVANPTNIAAIIAEELAALAADARTLAERLSPGEIVKAVVLPSNGLTDLLDVGGLRVAAELPPTLLPGEAISVMVIGFAGDRINLQIVPAAQSSEPNAPPEPEASRAGAGSSGGARLPVERAKNAAPLAGPSPARGVVPLSARGATPLPPLSGDSPRVRPAPPPAAAMRAPGEGASGRTVPALHTIEARLAASHVASPTAARPPVPARSPGPAVSVRPPIAPANTAKTPAPLLPAPRAAPAHSAPPAAGRGPAAFREPGVLLRALHLPVTATNLAAARQALAAPEKLPAALSALDRALADSADPRLTTLKTLTAFLARLDPRSPLFAVQISAFADHVVTGREARIAQLTPAAQTAELPHAAAAHTAESPHATAAQTAELPHAAAGQTTEPGTTAAERNAAVKIALDYDFKSQLLAVAGTHDGSDASPKAATLDRAVSSMLCAVTAIQLGAASSLAANPGGLAFSVPVALPDGFAQAHVRIGRDAPGAGAISLDGDNFHIAFVLETRRLGTVAIELMTVGRDVTLRVKTEAEPAQRTFSRALGSLCERLESLNYRVAKADATVAAPAPAAAVEPAAPAAPLSGSADRRASDGRVDTDA